MKKLLLGLGTIAAVVAPVSAVIACDMGTLTMHNDATSTLTKDAFTAKVDELQATKPADFGQIERDLKLSCSLFTSTGKVTFGDITFDGTTLTIKTNTVNPKGPDNSEETTMEFNQTVTMTFGATA